MIKSIAIGIAALMSALAIMVVMWGIAFGWGWITAGPTGQLEARQDILSGDTRIAAYNHFHNLCASIQGNEGQIDELEATLETISDEGRDRILVSIAGVRGARHQAIAQYNADASKDYTIGQFLDLELPRILVDQEYPEGGKTKCEN